MQAVRDFKLKKPKSPGAYFASIKGMKFRLHIENGPYVSYLCEGFVEEDGRVRFMNRDMAKFIGARMRCRILRPGKSAISGHIRKNGAGDAFIFETTEERRSA